MKFTLIQKMNESLKDKDVFEKALAESGIEFDMGNGESEELENDGQDFDQDMESGYPGDNTEQYSDDQDYSNGKDDELQRIADYYKQSDLAIKNDNAQGTHAEMGGNDLAEQIGNDLEQLGYTPEEVESGIEQVMQMLGRDETMSPTAVDADPETTDDAGNSYIP